MDRIDSDSKIDISNQSYSSLCKNTNSRGCGKENCPCERWINCPLYVDITEQHLRLKLKTSEKEITEWYEIYFRFNGEFHDLYCSG